MTTVVTMILITVTTAMKISVVTITPSVVPIRSKKSKI
jgi:hypothetical protein